MKWMVVFAVIVFGTVTNSFADPQVQKQVIDNSRVVVTIPASVNWQENAKTIAIKLKAMGFEPRKICIETSGPQKHVAFNN